MCRMIKIHDLVIGFIENERYHGYPEAIKGYYSKKLAILKELFACPVNVSHVNGKVEYDDYIDLKHADKVEFISEMAHLQALVSISERNTWDMQEKRWFGECIRLAAIEKNPFRYITRLCGLPPEFEMQNSDLFEERRKTLDELYIRVATKLLIMLCPGIEDKSFTANDLTARGLPTTPPNIIEHMELDGDLGM
jgi:hypothetical protein